MTEPPSDASAPPYAGRFAPTPSGPLHVGSLVAALASFCEARSRGGRWMLRIDDIDPPRERAGAAIGIVRTLARYGFVHDGPIRYQSERLDRYRAALASLAERGLLYRCRCTRRELRGQPRYPGSCRAARVGPGDAASISARPIEPPLEALRIRLEGHVHIDDAVQGAFDATFAQSCGDVVLRRRDGLVAYPLASAVDDADVAQVVRGADLFDASAAQLAVLERLDLPAPAWAHVPVALAAGGHKLGKSSDAPPVDALDPLPTLLGVWRFLGQVPLGVDTLDTFWREAPRRWSLAAVPRVRERAFS